MGGTRFTSPERGWKAGLALLAAAGLAGSLVSRGTPAAGLTVGWILVTALLVLAFRILRTHLTVDDEGLTDHRVLRTVRIPWRQVTEFRVGRPGGMWGGFCVAAFGRDGTRTGLMATHAYSRVPAARHLDEVHRMCWTLEEIAHARYSALPGPPAG